MAHRAQDEKGIYTGPPTKKHALPPICSRKKKGEYYLVVLFGWAASPTRVACMPAFCKPRENRSAHHARRAKEKYGKRSFIKENATTTEGDKEKRRGTVSEKPTGGIF